MFIAALFKIARTNLDGRMSHLLIGHLVMYESFIISVYQSTPKFTA